MIIKNLHLCDVVHGGHDLLGVLAHLDVVGLEPDGLHLELVVVGVDEPLDVSSALVEKRCLVKKSHKDRLILYLLCKFFIWISLVYFR